MYVCDDCHEPDDGLFCACVPREIIRTHEKAAPASGMVARCFFVAKGETMQIIDYFHSENPEHWRTQIAQYEWRAAKYLAHLLETGEFHSFAGEGTLYLLTDGDKLVSFVSLAERDCIDVTYTPWIGFVHTAPEYRGHRYVGKLIDHACAVAGEHGTARVYICTDHVGLYEKYGFTYLENRVDHFGGESRVYFRDSEKMKGSLNT